MSGDIAYHYKACGLDNVYLLNGFTIHEDDGYGKSVSFEDIEGLHRAIGTMLINAPRPLTGKEMRFLRKEMELSQETLAKLFGVDVQTVANWEKGKTKTKELGDRLLRLLYVEYIQANPHICDLLESLSQSIDGKLEKLNFERGECGDWRQAA